MPAARSKARPLAVTKRVAGTSADATARSPSEGSLAGAVYRILNGQRTAFGIHAYGGVRVNSATRIIRFVFDNIARHRPLHNGLDD